MRPEYQCRAKSAANPADSTLWRRSLGITELSVLLLVPEGNSPASSADRRAGGAGADGEGEEIIHIAPLAAAFVVERLTRDRSFSPHTMDSCSGSLLLIAVFAAGRLGVQPSSLPLGQLSADLVLDFLDHLETEHGNSVRTRNAGLPALKSFFRYLEYREPACRELSRQVHAIPEKRGERPLPHWLDLDEVQAIVDAAGHRHDFRRAGQGDAAFRLRRGAPRVRADLARDRQPLASPSGYVEGSGEGAA